MTELKNTIHVWTRLVVFAINIIVNLFVVLPIVIYSYSRFNALTKNTKLLIIQKRYPSLVKVQCYLCFFMLLFERSIIVFFHGNFTEFVDPETIYILWRVARVLYPCLSIIFWFGLWRFYHIYYELQIAKFLSESQWKQYLNSNLLQKTWYVTNKPKYGSIQYTTRIMLTMIILVTVIRIAVFQLFELVTVNGISLHLIVDMVLYLLPITLIAVLSCKAPSIQDKFYIKQEMLYCALTLYVILALYTSFIIMNNMEIMDTYWVKCIFSYLVTGAGSSLCIIQTLWIQCQIQKDPTYDKTVYESAANESMSVIENKVVLIAKTMNMKRYMAQQKGFELFVEHLQQEFSLELILFTIEMAQFKALMQSRFGSIFESDVRLQHLSETHQVEIDSAHESDEYKIEDYVATIMHLNIPKSQIVHQLFDDEKPNLMPTNSFNLMLKSNDVPEFSSFDSGTSKTDLIKFKTVSFLLYMRYIKSGAELEINISSSCRHALDEQLRDIKNKEIDASQLYHVFDEAMYDICSLLVYAFDRFKMEHLLK